MKYNTGFPPMGIWRCTISLSFSICPICLSFIRVFSFLVSFQPHHHLPVFLLSQWWPLVHHHPFLRPQSAPRNQFPLPVHYHRPWEVILATAVIAAAAARWNVILLDWYVWCVGTPPVVNTTAFWPAMVAAASLNGAFAGSWYTGESDAFPVWISLFSFDFKN